MDEVFLRLAARLATVREVLGRDAYLDAIARAEVGVARSVLEFSERRARSPRSEPARPATILAFPRARKNRKDTPGK